MKAETLIPAVILTLVISLNSALALGGATVPWTTYEAENMTNTGTILGPSYAGNDVASESSGRQCVQLNATGQYVQFTAQSNANAIVVRYSVPDTTNGVGADYTLSLYQNSVFVGKLVVTSKYSWLYGAYEFYNTPSNGSPRNFFDEVRTNGVSINAGDVVKLQKDATDTASYYVIDLVDLENVAAPISQPGGSASIKSAPYNAVGDGITDDTTALTNCINANTSVWLPPGNYKITASVNLPSNRTIQGAGMWYTTLVGDATLYTTSSRRVTLNGIGSNIHLSDFAILGKLNYRNDNEPNDGLGGSYGTGSTISNIWVEHTKTGAWIVNSLGLVVNSCRFRDTIADGINVDVGMRSTIVTNCTARGTGDDCFAIWPATYISQTYTPGLNVFTHCTGQVPFLANGGAIYGGASNTIEDCLFQDIPYDCGILISTTFPVGANTFSGTTVAQRCDLNRCGGMGMGAGLQICLNTYTNGISGVNLNNLNITNSVSDGMSIIGGSGTSVTGTLANAVAAYVSIPNYGIGTSGRNGLWARSDAVGSMTVSNSTIVEYRNDSTKFTFNFVTSNIPVTVQTSPTGLSFTADGTPYTTTQVFNWIPGSNHTIATSSPQSGGTGTQYVWSSWSDSGAMSHTITPNTSGTYMANFTTQYYLTMNAGSDGTVSPSSGWNNSGANVNISATASNGYSFSSWTGSGSGSYSGTNSATSVTMNGPITETASFTSSQLQAITFLQQPGNVLQGATITPEVQVQAFGTNGQGLVGATITLSLGSGTGTLAGTLARSTDASGIAHFNDLSVDTAGPKTLTAAANSKTTNSSSFMVIGPAVALAFTTQPDAAVAGQPFGQQPIIKTVDAFGNPTTLGLPTNLMVNVSRINGVGQLSGTTSLDIGTSAGNGAVTFSNLAIDTAGTSNQLVASTSSSSVSNPVSGMSIWLDGSMTSSVLTNASGIVTNWLDLSGNGNNFNTTIGSGGGGIRYTNTAANGRRTVTFNATSGGAATELKNTTYTNTSKTISVFVVAKKTVAGTNEGGYQHVFATWAGGSNPDYADVGSYLLDYNQNNNTPRVIRGCCTSYVDNNCPVMDPSANCHVFEYVANGVGSNDIWVALAGSTTQGAGPLFGNVGANFNIAASTVGGGMMNGTTVNNPFAGSIAEVLVYNSALSAADRTSVVNYLTNKWLAASAGFSLNSALSTPFDVQPPPISVTVQPNPPGLSFTVDGTPYTSAQTFNWTPGSNHTIATTTPQSGGAGAQYAWSSWSDSGAILHGVNPTVNTTYTANFAMQYYLTMNAGPGGGVSPVSDWYNSGTNVNISATALSGYVFNTWTGTGSGSYTGTNNPAFVTINGPITQTASFDFLAEIMGITIGSDGSVTISYATTPGHSYHVETTTNLTSSAWTTVPGSTTNAAGSIIIFIDPKAVGDPQRFYRVGSP